MKVHFFHGNKFSSGMAACALLALLALHPAWTHEQKRNKETNYYKKWLQEDVVYIISAEEKEVFQKLTSDEERDQFIEQFWARRDPDPSTSDNEFKEEHYRRLKYVNERFGSGKPGWKTDRGWFYIKFGPPDQKKDHPGGQYARESWEGGGVTSAFPFEKWWYRNIEGVGSDIELEFVDTTLSGDYKLALDADEKDALFYTPVGGTLQELNGMMNRGDRITRRYMGNPVNTDLQEQSGWFKYKRLQDQIWYRVDQMFKLEKPPALRNPKLREAVDAKVTYTSTLPFDVHWSYFPLDQSQFLVPLSVKVQNRDLEYATGDLGIQTSKVDLYIRVMGLNGKIFYEFDREIRSEYIPEEVPKRAQQFSVHQELLRLPPGRYKADILLKNRETRIGFSTLSLSLPFPDKQEEGLQLTPIVVAQYLSRLLALPHEITPFVIGNVKVVPAFHAAFGSNGEMGVYFQAHGFLVDQSTQKPKLQVRYEILTDKGKLLREYDDDRGQSYSVQGAGRLVGARKLPLLGLPAGRYAVKVFVRDEIAGREKISAADFEVAG